MDQRPFTTELAGQKMRGTVYLADDTNLTDKRRPTVVLLHGFTGNRIESGFLYVTLGRELAEVGINAVTFDFRGSGESDGPFDEMLVSDEIDDALRVLEWIGSQPYVDRARLGLLGFSLGGLVGSCVAARFAPIKALALLAPTTVDNLCRFAAGSQSSRRVVVGPHTLRADFFDRLKELDPLDDVVRRPRPTLVVQGTGDTAVSPDVADEYVQAMRRANVPVELVSIDKADHAFTAPPFRRRVVESVVQFFTANL